MNLLIISHTEHYVSNGEIVGWGPTVREINDLKKQFTKIYHIACLYKDRGAPLSAISYNNSDIEFIPISPFGGKSFYSKISVIKSAFEAINIINHYKSKVDAMQIRVPTGIANILLPWFSCFRPDLQLWVKYAGNWTQKKPPLGYQFQRWWLTQNYLNSIVTINGKWDNQPNHCISFENPCLEESERIQGQKLLQQKEYKPPFHACFIGRVESEKGIDRILDSAEILAKKGIKSIDLIGDGPNREFFEQKVKARKDIKFKFHGSIARDKIADFLSQSHFLLLPSTASEGFPKVIAEAWNYGAIPIVSNVSSIPQYVHPMNGFIWDLKERKSFSKFLEEQDYNSNKLKKLAIEGYKTAATFTFQYYRDRILREIVKQGR